MKMMRSTSMTSTSGVTLMSLRTTSMCAFLFPDKRQLRFAPLPFFATAATSLAPALTQHVVDELARDVVHVDDEQLDARREEVERHGRDDRDREAERGRHERFGDLRADR